MAKTRSQNSSRAPTRRRITFRLEDGAAQRVAVAGTFSDWDVKPIDMHCDGSGNWKAVVLLKPGRYEYRFLVDGVWQDDPACHERVPNEFGTENCVVEVPAATESNGA